MIREKQGRIDLMVTRDANYSPPKGSTLEHFRTMLNHLPSNMGLLVSIGRGNIVTNSFLSVVLNVPQLKHRWTVVKNIEEARIIIAQRRKITQSRV